MTQPFQNRSHGTRSRESGIALVTILILTSLLAVMGMTLNRAAGMRAVMSGSHDYPEKDRAYYTAAAGIEHALFFLKYNPGFRGALNPFGQPSPEIPFGEGSYSVLIEHSFSPAGDVLITSAGTIGSTVRTIAKNFFLEYRVYPPLIKDAHITDAGRALNYGGTSDLRIGAHEPGQAVRTLLEYDLSGIPPDATILSATLELYMFGSSAKFNEAGSHIEVRAHRLTKSWVEGIWDGRPEPAVNWKERDGNILPWGSWGGDYAGFTYAETPILFGDTNQWHSWDITSLVQYWVDHSNNNYGMILKDKVEGTANTREEFEGQFYSKEEAVQTEYLPKLTVVYEN